MDWEIAVSGDPPVIVARTLGEPSVVGFAALRDEVLSHPSFVAGIDVVYDHTDLSGTLSSNEIRSRLATLELEKAEAGARASKERPYWGRMAQVVPSPAHFGLARMWEAYAGDDLAARTWVFASIGEAYEWLGVTPPSP